MIRNKKVIEYGDFQTPLPLAAEVVHHVNTLFPKYKTIIEPNCGLGNFLKAVNRLSDSVQTLTGWDINPDYVNEVRSILAAETEKNCIIEQQDFFQIDWNLQKQRLDFPVLFIGNPPWGTNSELGKNQGKNLPRKTNVKNLSGLDAMTKKSNFDISERMMIQIAHVIENTDSAMAFLMKTNVARKIFLHICKEHLKIGNMSLRHIDAKTHFHVNVDACLFYAEGTQKDSHNKTCAVYDSLDAVVPERIMGIDRASLISNISIYENLKAIDTGSPFRWRSGIKHDCAKVMELLRSNRRYRNGLGETVDLPDTCLYPMYKSSDIVKPVLPKPYRFMIITQKFIGDSTKRIQQESPQTWEYLEKYAPRFESRKSSIYKNSKPYSIFGVGDYTFQPWKVGISGLYKNISFTVIGSRYDKPVVLDDTCYFLGFDNEQSARFVHRLLTSDIAKQLMDSLIFKEDKRPVTAALLNRINLEILAEMLGIHYEYRVHFPANTNHQKTFCLDY
ncbi:MAG: hypothetical protein LBQ54_12090 [Planctomycetaceae bacterium]|jgi:hypothetical protein|nr:hypothetical protein [Planctomycetaceae bacterium]